MRRMGSVYPLCSSESLCVTCIFMMVCCHAASFMDGVLYCTCSVSVGSGAFTIVSPSLISLSPPSPSLPFLLSHSCVSVSSSSLF